METFPMLPAIKDTNTDLSADSQVANGVTYSYLVETARRIKLYMDEKKNKIFFNGVRYPEIDDWQYAGAYVGYTVKTKDVIPVELDNGKGPVHGFKAHAVVLDRSGKEIGGAEAYMMRDEPGFAAKPANQLASKAQTRAASKALANILRPIMKLAGYGTTPAEEMENLHATQIKQPRAIGNDKEPGIVSIGVDPEYNQPIGKDRQPGTLTEKQRRFLFVKAKEAEISEETLKEFVAYKFKKDHTKDLSSQELDETLKWLEKNKQEKTFVEDNTEPQDAA